MRESIVFVSKFVETKEWQSMTALARDARYDAANIALLLYFYSSDHVHF